ncbi:MAG TPA: hypothetical protein VL882_20400 [Vicinamibacterales bacterium]|nr:hypothetical protein [Vicinamibacterales bacterium]
MPRLLQLPGRLFANGLYFALYALQFLLCAFKRLVGTLQILLSAFALALRPLQLLVRSRAFALGALQFFLRPLMIGLRALQILLRSFAIGLGVLKFLLRALTLAVRALQIFVCGLAIRLRAFPIGVGSFEVGLCALQIRLRPLTLGMRAFEIGLHPRAFRRDRLFQFTPRLRGRSRCGLLGLGSCSRHRLCQRAFHFATRGGDFRLQARSPLRVNGVQLRRPALLRLGVGALTCFLEGLLVALSQTAQMGVELGLQFGANGVNHATDGFLGH